MSGQTCLKLLAWTLFDWQSAADRTGRHWLASLLSVGYRFGPLDFWGLLVASILPSLTKPGSAQSSAKQWQVKRYKETRTVIQISSRFWGVLFSSPSLCSVPCLQNQVGGRVLTLQKTSTCLSPLDTNVLPVVSPFKTNKSFKHVCYGRTPAGNSLRPLEQFRRPNRFRPKLCKSSSLSFTAEPCSLGERAARGLGAKNGLLGHGSKPMGSNFGVGAPPSLVHFSGGLGCSLGARPLEPVWSLFGSKEVLTPCVAGPQLEHCFCLPLKWSPKWEVQKLGEGARRIVCPYQHWSLPQTPIPMIQA